MEVTRDKKQDTNKLQKTTNKPRFDLEERATEFGILVVRLCKQLPRNSINNRLISQLVGSAGSIGANYREANDALGNKDFVQRVKIARREAKETLHWLRLIKEANENKRCEVQSLYKEANELKLILSSILSKF